jgi:hypothetical protein
MGRLTLTTLDLREGKGRRHFGFYIESVKVQRDRQRLTTIVVEVTILAYRFSKKCDLLLLLTSGRESIAVEHSTDLQVSMPTSAGEEGGGARGGGGGGGENNHKFFFASFAVIWSCLYIQNCRSTSFSFFQLCFVAEKDVCEVQSRYFIYSISRR